MTAIAEFTDVGALAHGATVEMAGVSIGHVSHIQVDGSKARLVLVFPRSAHVPVSVTAQVRRAAVLGPQVIELIVPPGGANAALLADHATIASTDVRPDLEELIKSGTDLFGALSASQIATLLQEGAAAFGGEGGQIHQTLDNLDVVLTGYASRTATITSLVHDLDTLTASLGPNSDANALALANLARTTAVLDDQRTRFVNLLASLDTVSRQGVTLLATQLPQIADQLLALRTTTQALANQQKALGNILKYLPLHNAALAGSTVNDFIQVLNDFIICGVPGGGEDPTSPLNSCSFVPQASTP
jgi:phospholipid/cholesterol/gamma-HCH transport system substrate-binding protein